IVPLEIDSLVVARRVLDTRAGATKRAVEVGAEIPAQRHKVGHRSAVRRNRGQQMIVKSAFKIVGILGARRALEKTRGQLEHVVRIATFFSRGGKSLVAIN